MRRNDIGFGTDGEFALKPHEFWRCGDDLAADVLGWNCFLGCKTHLAGGVSGESLKTKENKMLRVLVMLQSAGQIALAEETAENLVVGDVPQDELRSKALHPTSLMNSASA